MQQMVHTAAAAPRVLRVKLGGTGLVLATATADTVSLTVLAPRPLPQQEPRANLERASRTQRESSAVGAFAYGASLHGTEANSELRQLTNSL